MNKKYLSLLFAVCAVLVTSFSAFADDSSDYAEKARDRRYIGGADESDLKVQKAVNTNLKTKAEENMENTESNEGF